jgi:hypothetical protein
MKQVLLILRKNQMMTTNKPEIPPALRDIVPEENSKLPALPEEYLNMLPASAEWQEIIESILDDLLADEGGTALPNDVIQAAELLIAGYPTVDVARKLGVKRDTVRSWLTRYPKIAKVVRYGQIQLHRWRMAQLERQFITAAQKSEELLNIPFDGEGVDPKILSALGLHIRYVIGLFAGQKIDLKITNPAEDTSKTLKGEENALDYIAGKLAERQIKKEAVEGEYRIVDAKQLQRGPLLDENGDPVFGSLGVLDRNEEGTICHVCGERMRQLQLHIHTSHKMSSREYELVFMLEQGTLTNGKY